MLNGGGGRAIASGFVTPLHERVVIGLELEAYTISTPDHEIGRELAFPRPGVGERGERFARDWSIGTEYNSRPFRTIREGLFLVKAGLRKYGLKHYRSLRRRRNGHALLLVGGWRDRFAGTHIHLSVDDRILSRDEARSLAAYLHDHIPFLVAVGANSPVWADELTEVASNRVDRASRIYFRVVRRGELTSRAMDEVTFSRGRITKPPTLELRVLDSNLPEFALAATCLVKAAALAWLRRRRAANRIPHRAYLRAREDAARRGMRAKLCWNGTWMGVRRYLDRFIWAHREELRQMDIPEDVWTTIRLLKRGVNGATIVADAAQRAYREHPQTWQRRFAKRYAVAIERLLSGNDIVDFMEHLGVEPPALEEVWLGRRGLTLW